MRTDFKNLIFGLIFTIEFLYVRYYKSENLYINTKFFINDPCVYISIICMRKECSRGIYAYKQWGDSFVKNHPLSTVRLANTQDFPEENIGIDITTENESGWRQVYYNAFPAYRNFLSHYHYKWFFRTTEDVFVNGEKLIELLNSLDSSEERPIIRGKASRTNVLFLHGGPGWIMNRKATQIWVDNVSYFNKKYKSGYSGDDVLTLEYIKFIGSSMENANLVPFIGWPMSKNALDILRNRTYDKIENCRFSNNQEYLYLAHPFKDTVAWHSGSPYNIAVIEGRDIINTIPENIYAFTSGMSTNLCKSNDTLPTTV